MIINRKILALKVCIGVCLQFADELTCLRSDWKLRQCRKPFPFSSRVFHGNALTHYVLFICLGKFVLLRERQKNPAHYVFVGRVVKLRKVLTSTG